jgi:hypothetical protein
MQVYNVIDTSSALANVLNELKKNHYKLELRREATCLYCEELQEWIAPGEFNIDESYYFQETDTPDADRMLCAISLSRGGKGFLIDSCNVYTDNISDEMTQKLGWDRIEITDQSSDFD